jgi:hypothetical protein
VSDLRHTHSSHASPWHTTATIGRAAILTAAVAVGVLCGPLALAGVLVLALISLGAAMSGGDRG